MFGFVFGTLCLVGLSVMAVRSHRYGHHRGCHGHRGRWRRHGLRYLFERLDTTPGQEKVIMSALDELSEQAREARNALRGARKEVAGAFREDNVDEGVFRTILETQWERLSPMRDEIAKTMATVHETLTPKQREKLASFVESMGHFGPRHAL